MFTTRAMEKWGYSPLSQNSKEISSDGNISPVYSGYLFVGNGTALTMEMLESFTGASYAFDAKGGSIAVNLPVGETTTTGDPAVVITKVASLTKTNVGWVYAGQ